MKVFAMIATMKAAVVELEIPTDNQYMPKRYTQFSGMFSHFYTEEQLIKTYGYGCYCLNLGDRPLAGIMTGVFPVDKKDKHCFEFTRCNRCVTFDFGPECTPEQISYDFEITADDEVICKDPANTCQNAICQCDKATILGFKEFIDIYDSNHHAFHGFNTFSDCEVKNKEPLPGKPAIDCCGEYPNRRPYNKNSDKNMICCDGEITSDNQCVNSSFNKK